MIVGNQICYDDVCFTGSSSGNVQPGPPQQSPGLTPPGRTPTPPGQPRSGSKGSGGSGSGSQGGNGNSPIEIDDLIDGLDDPNFWMIQEMKRREAEMLAAMERAARSKKKAYSLLFANVEDDASSDVSKLPKRLPIRSKGPTTHKSTGGTVVMTILPDDPRIAAVQLLQYTICALCTRLDDQFDSINSVTLSPDPGRNEQCFNLLGGMCDALCGGDALANLGIDFNDPLDHSYKGLFQRWIEYALNDRSLRGTPQQNHINVYRDIQSFLSSLMDDWNNDGNRCTPSGDLVPIIQEATGWQNWDTRPLISSSILPTFNIDGLGDIEYAPGTPTIGIGAATTVTAIDMAALLLLLAALAAG